MHVNLNRTKIVVILFVLALTVNADMVMDSPSDDADAKLASLQEHSSSKGLHWLISLFLLVLVPSLSASYAVANYFQVSILIQIFSAVYAAIEAIALRFPDPSDHENKTSRGTAWFLAFFYCLTIFIGAISVGSSEFAIKLRESKFSFLASSVSTVAYKVLSCLLVLCGFIKAAMNVVAMLGFCYDDHTGQCNAHGIMGMSFIAYGYIMAMMLVIPWLRINKGSFSNEFYDSAVITLWGIINTFTEHRPWEPWSHGDYQHTSMGIIFWACGMLGIFLSWGRKRNFIPALTLIFTGYSMSQHVQQLVISTKVHAFFGYVLILGGFARIAEITFLLDDEDAAKDGKIRSFQYLPSFALVLSGCLFMSANEEQLQLVVNMGADHSAYTMLIISAACLIQLWLLAVLRFYLRLTGSSDHGKYQNLFGADDLETAGANEREDDFQLDDLSDLESHI